MLKRIAIACAFATGVLCANGQTLDSASAKLKSTEQFANVANKKLSLLEAQIEKETLKTLGSLTKQETRLKRKLFKKDSAAAINLFSEQPELYNQLSEKIRHPQPADLKEYIPQFDSLKTALRFLNSSPEDIAQKMPKELAKKLTAVNSNLSTFESKMQEAEKIKQVIKARKQLLQQQFGQYGLGKNLKKLNKQVYYYNQQLAEYKALLKDRKKAEEKCMAMLRELPAFKEFMKKNSQLASLFRVPENYGTAQSLNGLQTRAAIQGQIQARFAGSGINPQQYISQQVQQAQDQLNKLKEKINKLGGSSSDMEMPDFQPNSQKTKRFLQRLEYGANIQSQKTNGWLPVTSDIALTIGYKLNNRSVIGLGAAYKLGWGSSWKNIKFTNEGVGLRSYIDWKLAPIFGKIDGFWLSGGYEQNYQHAFNNIPELSNYSAWQSSGLIGITKKVKIGKRTNSMQVLWDFLSYSQVPRRQAVVYRVGIKL